LRTLLNQLLACAESVKMMTMMKVLNQLRLQAVTQTARCTSAAISLTTGSVTAVKRNQVAS
jgi:hypothetical protein